MKNDGVEVDRQSRRIKIKGIVQGVGFRPHVYTLAKNLDLAGWVRNTSAGVDISVSGSSESLTAFSFELQRDPPPLARIDSIDIWASTTNGAKGFEILHSEPNPDDFIPVSPDACICTDCVRELFDPEDRRYGYPFINCTNCGPRFTIIKDIPYDRPMTTMASFEMCPACRSEYENPLDRRFHAQPIACPACGPKIWLERGQKRVGDFDRVEVIKSARKMLEEGLILAIKGLGGFHLACDATKTDVVEKLRQRKLRRDKPFALMMPDLETVSEHCELDANQRELLSSNARPIVILTRRDSSSIAAAAAPGQNTLGVMLPYTPLHTLLLAGETARVLVMTSGNLAEEPIAHLNEDAQTRLAPLADAFLMHDRDIHVRCDDSVFRIAIRGRPSPLRRSRGYSPDPIIMPVKTIPVFASGAELKNTFCMTRENYAFMSHHIGDLENYETLRSFEEGVSHFENLFRIQIQALAHDLHPNYLATRYVLARSEADNIPALGVQHHHAHIAACMAENGLSGERPVIGVAFDGTGYGTDGKIWGGEFLIADYDRCERVNHLDYLPLPGGDLAIREPWRVALAALRSCGFRWEDNLPPVFGRESKVLSVLDKQLDTGINLAWTSSMGRLFDAAAALMGVRQTVNYEAQAAIELEHLVDSIEPGAYRFGFTVGGLIDPVPVFNQIIEDLRNEQPIPIMSARFHNGIAEMVLDNCLMLRARYGLNQVALSGGVWQNNVLLSKTALHLENAGFEVLYHHIVPANDGGLSLGQAVIAAHYFTK